MNKMLKLKTNLPCLVKFHDFFFFYFAEQEENIYITFKVI